MASTEDQDFFLLLPETLISIILSLLPLKDSVRTSILSVYWRNLWKKRPNIEINENKFIHAHHERQSDQETLDQQFACMAFARSWLEALDNDLTKISYFTLIFSNPSLYQFDMESFIGFALSHGTKSLELDFSDFDWENRLPITNSDTYSERFVLPQLVSKYHFVESLKLVSCRFSGDLLINIGRALKSLSLGWIEIKTSILRNLIKNCPCLESLTLFKCFNTTIFVIESKTLKILKVDKCIDLLNLSVEAPHLESFMYCGNVVEFGFNEFPLLKEADFDFGLVEFFDLENHGDMIIDLFSSLYFAKSLRVCAYITQVLPVALDSTRLQGRPRVKDLTIKTMFHAYEFCGIFCLLNSFPFVQNLCFEVQHQTIFEEDYVAPVLNWSTAVPLTAGCIKRELEVVEIKGFEGNSNEIHVLGFLISHGAGLRKLILRVAQHVQHAQVMAMHVKSFIASKLSNLDVVIIS